ncbi:MAG: 2OG-Fe(II) oxygenase [Cyanobacteria bacterium J06554_11]
MTLTTKLSSVMGGKLLGKGVSKLRSEVAYRAELMKHIGRLPALSQEDRKLCEQLKQTGVVRTSLASLGLSLTPQLMQATREMVPQLQRASVVGNLSDNVRSAASHCLYGDPVAIAQKYSAIHLWGLQDRLLDILENYYGAPVSCIGVNMRRDIADGKQKGTKLWHIDWEDRKVMKIAIYLNDVDDDGGPFEYIPLESSPSYRDFPSSAIYDEDMEKVVSRSKWVACKGPTGTVVFADNAKLFHHGRTPLRDRYTIFYAYAYRQPKRPEACEKSPWRKGIPYLADKLTQRQKDSIWNYEGLPIIPDVVKDRALADVRS